MKWKDYLESKGYVYDADKEWHTKSLGFGRKISVWMFMRGMFIIVKNGKTVYRDFPKSFEEFKNIVYDLECN